MKAAQKPVAIITGASAGIGEAIAQRLVKGGFNVVAVARRPDKLSELEQRLSAAGGQVRVLATDVTAADAPARAVALDQIRQRWAALVEHLSPARALSP